MAWKIVSAAMMAAGLLGCSVHSQAPIRQVAYDFSDHAYYDRDFAPSPNYAEGQGYYGHAWAAPVGQQQHVHVSHVEGSCGCDHDARGNDNESATNDHEEPRRAARPRVDFDGDRDGSVASGRVNERDGKPMASPEARRSVKTSGDDRIAGR